MNIKNPVSKLMLVASLSFIFSISGFAQQTEGILASYLQIKDALVKTDSKSAGVAAEELVALVGDQSDDVSLKVKANAKEIWETNDIKVQRKHFNDLSQNVYALVKSSSNSDKPVYKQYCPMAFNNTGAFWLAAEKEINNPYFGDMMLHCGMVKEEL